MKLRALTTIAAAPSLFLLACTTPGERAETGECPTGEACSPLTPRGLTFHSVVYSDALFIDGIQPTAVGGRQTISILDARTGNDLALAFTATTDNTAFRILEQGPSRVQIHANSAGRDRLRIAEPENNLLFDRVAIPAAELGSIGLRTKFFDEVSRPGAPMALWSGAQVPVIVALFARTGERLVDESLVITSPGGRQHTWDWATVAATGTAVTVAVTPGNGNTLTTSIDVVTQLDRIEPIDNRTTTGLDQFDTFCFAAITRDADVRGAPWQITLTGPATVQDNTLYNRNCIGFETTGVGTVTITAQVGAVTRTAQLTVVDGARLAPRPWGRLDANAQLTAGERNALAVELDDLDLDDDAVTTVD